MPTKAAHEGKHVALTKCFFCGGDGTILLHKRLGDISEAHGKVCDMEPCSKCSEYMKQGIILIGIDDAKSGNGWSIPPDPGSRDHGNWVPNPYRTGAFVVIKDAALERAINPPELAAGAKKHRWMFIEHAALVQMGAIKA